MLSPSSGAPVWDDGSWSRLPELSGELTADVCVVGLGGSGLAAVHELLGDGARVVGIDAGIVGGGAAGRNGGFLLAGLAAFHHEAIRLHGHERAHRLYALTVAQIERMRGETPDVIRCTGSLRIAASPDEALDCAAHHAALAADGFPVERYSGPEGEGLLLPGDAVVQPLARCRILADRALKRGALLFEGSRALELLGGRVQTQRGRVRCGGVVVGVDGALGRVLPELASRVRGARLQMLATAPIARRFSRPVYTRWGFDYWRQLDDGRLVLGGRRDRDEPGEWTESAEPSVAIQRALEHMLREELSVAAPVTHRWAASVSYSSTGLPVLEEVRPQVWASGAYSGTGNVVGALCGRAAAQLALHGRSEIADAFRGSPRRQR